MAFDNAVELKETVAASFWTNGPCLPAMAMIAISAGILEVATVQGRRGEP